MEPMSQELLQAVGVFVKDVGLPGAILAGILWWLHKATSVVHATVVQPVVKAHTDFLKTTQDNQDRQSRALEVLASGKEQTTEILHQIANGQKDIHDDIRALVQVQSRERSE